MKMTEITSMSIKDIDVKIEELKGQIFEVRLQKYTSGVEKTHDVKMHKKTIARLLTQKTVLGRKA